MRSFSWITVLVAAAGCGASSQPATTPECPEPPPPRVAEPEAPPALEPAVVTAADQDKRAAPSGQAWITILGQGNEAFIGRLELAAGAAVPEHQDPTEEYIHVVEGTGTMIMNGETHEVGPGTTVFMPAGATVSFQNGPERLVAIQVFAGPEPAAKYDTWQAAATTPPAASTDDEDGEGEGEDEPSEEGEAP